jgi:hypothetical protein
MAIFQLQRCNSRIIKHPICMFNQKHFFVTIGNIIFMNKNIHENKHFNYLCNSIIHDLFLFGNNYCNHTNRRVDRLGQWSEAKRRRPAPLYRYYLNRRVEQPRLKQS